MDTTTTIIAATLVLLLVSTEECTGKLIIFSRHQHHGSVAVHAAAEYISSSFSTIRDAARRLQFRIWQKWISVTLVMPRKSCLILKFDKFFSKVTKNPAAENLKRTRGLKYQTIKVGLNDLTSTNFFGSDIYAAAVVLVRRLHFIALARKDAQITPLRNFPQNQNRHFRIYFRPVMNFFLINKNASILNWDWRKNVNKTCGNSVISWSVVIQ